MAHGAIPEKPTRSPTAAIPTTIRPRRRRFWKPRGRVTLGAQKARPGTIGERKNCDRLLRGFAYAPNATETNEWPSWLNDSSASSRPTPLAERLAPLLHSSERFHTPGDRK